MLYEINKFIRETGSNCGEIVGGTISQGLQFTLNNFMSFEIVEPISNFLTSSALCFTSSTYINKQVKGKFAYSDEVFFYTPFAIGALSTSFGIYISKQWEKDKNFHAIKEMVSTKDDNSCKILAQKYILENNMNKVTPTSLCNKREEILEKIQQKSLFNFHSFAPKAIGKFIGNFISHVIYADIIEKASSIPQFLTMFINLNDQFLSSNDEIKLTSLPINADC